MRGYEGQCLPSVLAMGWGRGTRSSAAMALYHGPRWSKAPSRPHRWRTPDPPTHPAPHTPTHTTGDVTKYQADPLSYRQQENHMGTIIYVHLITTGQMAISPGPGIPLLGDTILTSHHTCNHLLLPPPACSKCLRLPTKPVDAFLEPSPSAPLMSPCAAVFSQWPCRRSHIPVQ